MQTPSPAPIEYVSNLKRALIYNQINEKDFYPFSPIDSSRSLLSSTVKGTKSIIDQTRRAWAFGQVSAAMVQDPSLIGSSAGFGGPAPADFVDDLRRSLLYGGLTYTDLGDFYIPPYGATFWRDFTKFQTLNHGTGIPLSCTRSGSASYIGSDGQMKIAQVNEPRFDYDPITLQCKGLLCEVTRKNFILQSEVGVTQGPIAVTNGTTYTLSFYGTGTVFLTGNIYGIVSAQGLGAYPTRTTYTFTCYTVGGGTVNVTVNVSGTVRYLQFETGSFATSWIPTGPVSSLNDTRGQDAIESSSAGLPTSVFDPVRGTLYASFARYQTDLQRAGFINFRSDGQHFYALQSGTGSQIFSLNEFRKRPEDPTPPGAIQETIIRNYAPSLPNTTYKLAGAYDNSSSYFRLFQNGSNVGTQVQQNNSFPTGIYRVQVGRTTTDTASTHGWIRQVAYMPTALSQSQLAALTS